MVHNESPSSTTTTAPPSAAAAAAEALDPEEGTSEENAPLLTPRDKATATKTVATIATIMAGVTNGGTGASMTRRTGVVRLGAGDRRAS